MKHPPYYFYLNPHDEYKWTRCPKCDLQTRARKYCLMIHYEDKAANYRQMISLNKSCKFCTHCELIIAQKSEVEHLLNQIVSNKGLKFIPNHYFVFGTMDRKHWNKGQKEAINPAEALNTVAPFIDVWDFDIRPAGWYLDED